MRSAPADVTSPALDLRFPADADLGDLISAELHDLSPTAIHEIESDSTHTWRVFFASPLARDEAQRALAQQPGLEGLAIAPVDVPDEDWAVRSQADLRHVRIGRIIVAPPWDLPPSPAPDDLLVLIRPSMGFGTGHHATTRLCLRLLQRIGCAGKRVLDVGTGSGVLAIAAAKLRASDVMGIDVDPDALASAEESLGLNEAVRERVRFINADLSGLVATADLVLANLTSAALVASASTLLRCAGPHGRLVVSGFQTHESDAVIGAFADRAACEAIETEEGWAAALMRARR